MHIGHDLEYLVLVGVNTFALSFANVMFNPFSVRMGETGKTKEREETKFRNSILKKKSKSKTDRTAHGSVKVPAEIDYQCKTWHRHKVELNTSISNHSGIFSQNQYTLLSQRVFL